MKFTIAGGRDAAGVAGVLGMITAVGVFTGTTMGPPDERGPNRYVRTDLVTDDASVNPAAHTDAHLVNAWGITPNPTGFWWVSDNGSGTSTLYDEHGTAQPLVVTIPAPAGSPDPAKTTGIVYNGSNDFVVSDGAGHMGAARFLFATEDGLIAGWAPGVPPPAPSTAAMAAVNSTASGAIYKGLAIGRAPNQAARLYATDFHNGRVDVFDGMFAPVHEGGGFVDGSMPAHYAPFGIQNINGRIFVTYAQQDASAEDNVKGPGKGFVDEFDTQGTLVRRFASRGRLNAPWGIALAPEGFGKYSGHLLIGNFGNGRINAFDLEHGSFDDVLRDHHHRAIEIDGLWGIAFGNGGQAGPTSTLFFGAGPGDESHGLFGRIDPPAPHGHGGEHGGE